MEAQAFGKEQVKRTNSTKRYLGSVKGTVTFNKSCVDEMIIKFIPKIEAMETSFMEIKVCENDGPLLPLLPTKLGGTGIANFSKFLKIEFQNSSLLRKGKRSSKKKYEY